MSADNPRYDNLGARVNDSDGIFRYILRRFRGAVRSWLSPTHPTTAVRQ